jgi:hypothetical protein
MRLVVEDVKVVALVVARRFTVVVVVVLVSPPWASAHGALGNGSPPPLPNPPGHARANTLDNKQHRLLLIISADVTTGPKSYVAVAPVAVSTHTKEDWANMSVATLIVYGENDRGIGVPGLAYLEKTPNHEVRARRLVG